LRSDYARQRDPLLPNAAHVMSIDTDLASYSVGAEQRLRTGLRSTRSTDFLPLLPAPAKRSR